MKISRKQAANSDLEISDRVANQIKNVGSISGSPLDTSTKGFMESRFSYDFSKVKIHIGETATRSAGSVNALAYTLGNNIVFGQGQYQPNTLKGKRLLAHELTHVVQQSNASYNPYGLPTREDDSSVIDSVSPTDTVIQRKPPETPSHQDLLPTRPEGPLGSTWERAEMERR